MIYELHLPQCAIWTKGIQPMSTMRRLSIERRKDAHEVGVMIPTPRELAKRPVAVDRMRLVGKAVFETLEDNWPRFHYSVIGGNLMLTDGTTLLLTGRTRDDKDTIAATWDYFETVFVAMRRLSNMRRLLEELPPEVSYALMSTLEMPNLPPPQALLTDVISVGMDTPVMALGGCAGATPIALGVGRQMTHVVFDHRIFDPQDEMIFVDSYQKRLEDAL